MKQVQAVRKNIEAETKDHYVIVYYQNQLAGSEAYGSIGAIVYISNIFDDDDLKLMEFQELSLPQKLSKYIGERSREIEDRLHEQAAA